MTSMLDNALALLARGFAVFPIYQIVDGRCACSNKDCGRDAGKHPASSHGFKDASRDRTQIEQWWTERPGSNVGVATGAPSGIFVLDVDPRNGGDGELARIETQHGALPETLTVHTGGGGLHVVFRYPGSRRWRREIARGLDVKADGGYVVGVGSNHLLGDYSWLVDAPIAQAPDWLVAMATKVERTATTKLGEAFRAVDQMAAAVAEGPHAGYARAALAEELARVRGAVEGERNNTLNIAGFALGTLIAAGLLRRGPVESLLREAAAPLMLEEPEKTERTLQSSIDDGAAQPRELPTPHFRFTDVGNGERFAYLNRERAVYVPPWKAWLCWNGMRWTRDEGGTIHAWAKEVPRALLLEASKAEDDDKRKMLSQMATKLEGAPRLAAMLAMAAKEVSAVPSAFDQHRHLLNVESGTIDLRTGLLLPHDRSNYLSKLVSISFGPSALAPRWEQFLREVFAGDEELIAYMKRAVGYALTGETREQVFFVLHGSRGKNGKGRFIRQLRLLLGDAAETTAYATLTADRAKIIGNTPELAKLAGARVVVVGEPDKGVRLSESVIKSLTGEDEIMAMAKHEAPFSFTPQFKVFIHCNHAPAIRGTDDAIWRRPQLIPFAVRFDGEGENPVPDLDLDAKLDAERAGILRWAVEGAVEWYAHGLGTCAAVTKATSEYRKDSDALGPFIEECLTLAAVDAFVPHTKMYAVYTTWCERNGVEAWQGRTLTTALLERGYQKHSNGVARGFKGVAIRDGAERRVFEGIGRAGK